MNIWVWVLNKHTSSAVLTANTKGNKRSRTRNDSYTAGQSVGESRAESTAARASRLLLTSSSAVPNVQPAVVFAEALDGIDLGETTHKKPGNTVPESIHSFSEWPTYPGAVAPRLFASSACFIMTHSCPAVTTSAVLPGNQDFVFLIWDLTVLV